MVEKNPWWKNVSGPFPKWEGPVGCKDDGGGCHYGRGKVGNMIIHRAVNNRVKEGNYLYRENYKVNFSNAIKSVDKPTTSNHRKLGAKNFRVLHAQNSHIDRPTTHLL